MNIDTIILKNEFYFQKIILLEDSIPQEINIHEEREFHEGYVCLGKIKKKIDLPNNNIGFFVDIGDYKDAFLPGFEKYLENDNLCEGQNVIVEIIQEARDEKGAKLKRSIDIASDNLVYSPFKMGVSISSKIKEENKLLADELYEFVFENIENQEGWIIRTSASGVDKSVLLEEMRILRERYEYIYSHKNEKAPKCIYKPAHPVASYISKYRNSLKEIIVDDMGIYNDLLEFNRMHNLIDDDIIKCVSQVELNQIFDVDEVIYDALKREVNLKSGGKIYIEPTKAFTSIDVDTGDTNSISVSAVNNEAAKEIVRQIRLRNIAGKIVIDFAGSKDYKFMKKSLDILVEEVKNDYSKSWVAGLTRAGNVEIVRTRKRPSIYDELEANCYNCYGTGKIKNYKIICFELCQKIYQKVVNENATSGEVKLNKKIADSLNSRFSYLFELLKKKIGFTPKFIVCDELAVDEYEIEIS